MDFTSLCINTFMVMIVLLVAQATRSDFVQTDGEALQPRITPDRLQFYLYEKINITCEQITGLTEWRVIQKPFRKFQTSVHSYNQSTPDYKISFAERSHSGTYWCENADGETSNAVNITITDGDVILDVSASPVMEGHDVSLFCQHSTSQKQHRAEFYKDDGLLNITYDSKLTMRNVSKSDEGLYKCIVKAAESPESWLSVIKMGDKYDPELQSTEQQVSHPSIFLWIVSGAIVTVLLLLVLGLFFCQTHKASAEHSDADPEQATYAAVKKTRKKKVPCGDGDLESDNVTYAQVQSFRFKKGSNRSSRRQKQSLLEDGDIYSTIKHM